MLACECFTMSACMANWHMSNCLIWWTDFGKSAYGKMTSYRHFVPSSKETIILSCMIPRHISISGVALAVRSKVPWLRTICNFSTPDWKKNQQGWIIVICSDHRLLWRDSYKGVDWVLTSDESSLHKIIILWSHVEMEWLGWWGKEELPYDI